MNQLKQQTRIRKRPALAGMSCATFRVTACTLGKKVFKNGKSFILGNAHCYFKHYDGCKKGDPVVQPSRVDKGVVDRDTIAKASEYVEIKFDGTHNLVDCALSEIIKPEDVSNEIMEMGEVNLPIAEVKPGEIIQKSGRTTGLTSGRVLAVNATAMVNFRVGGKKILTRWKDQIITEAMVDGGDSSSLAVNSKNQPIGLCYAGSPRVSIFNRIQNVQRLLGFTFNPPTKPIEGWIAIGRWLSFYGLKITTKSRTNFRSSARIRKDNIIQVLPARTKLKIQGETKLADGFLWVKVRCKDLTKV